MSDHEYKNKVIELFKSGTPTDEQWAEMANAILSISKSNEYKNVFMIDREVDNEDESTL